MASDGLFFPAVARLDPRTKVPVVALVLQGVIILAIVSARMVINNPYMQDRAARLVSRLARQGSGAAPVEPEAQP